MDNQLIYRLKEPLVVLASAFAATLSLAAANAAYLRHVSSHAGYTDSVLVLVSKPAIYLATLNKVLVPFAMPLLGDTNVEDWIRVATMLGALFGIGIGTLVGFYLLLWLYGLTITRKGDAFGWGVLRAFKWFCIAICGAYAFFGLWQLVRYQQSLEVDILLRAISYAGGFLALAVLGFGLLGSIGCYCYAMSKEWHRRRKFGK